MAETAKVFMNGRSQAVRLPAAFRFAESEVFIRRDEETGDVILSRRPGNWADFFDLIAKLDVPKDFMADRQDGKPQDRDIL